MMSIEAMKLALEALDGFSEPYDVLKAQDALRQAIEQAEQAQPVAFDDWYKNAIWGNEDFKAGCHRAWNASLKHNAPPPRQPLTDEQKDAARWRFLVDNSYDKEGVTQFHVWEHSWEPHSQTGEPTEWKQRVRGPALDRFIDRAIEAAHGIKGEA